MRLPKVIARSIRLLLGLLLVSATAGAAYFFVSATGSPAGDGSVASPWDLPTAFNHPAAVQPGDTLWLRGGNYVSTSRLSPAGTFSNRSEEHTSELQSRLHLVCRLLLEKKKKKQ